MAQLWWPEAPTSAAQLPSQQQAAASSSSIIQHDRPTDQALTTHVHRQLLSPRIAARYSCSHHFSLLIASTFAAPAACSPPSAKTRRPLPFPGASNGRIAHCCLRKPEAAIPPTKHAQRPPLCHFVPRRCLAVHNPDLLFHTVASPIFKNNSTRARFHVLVPA